MYKHCVAFPAYGRNYPSKARLLEDWEKDLDFKLVTLSGVTYFNKAQVPDLKKDEYTHIHFRYGKNHEKLLVVDLRKIPDGEKK